MPVPKFLKSDLTLVVIILLNIFAGLFVWEVTSNPAVHDQFWNIFLQKLDTIALVVLTIIGLNRVRR